MRNYKIIGSIAVLLLSASWLFMNIKGCHNDIYKLDEKELNQYWSEFDNNNSEEALEKLWNHYLRNDYQNTEKVIILRKAILQKKPSPKNYYYLGRYMSIFNKGDQEIHTEGIGYLKKASMMGYKLADKLLIRIAEEQNSSSSTVKGIKE